MPKRGDQSEFTQRSRDGGHSYPFGFRMQEQICSQGALYEPAPPSKNRAPQAEYGIWRVLLMQPGVKL